MDEVLAGLDPEQRQVAEALDTPVVLLAGAGSGKTRAITHRLAYAVKTGRYNPNASLALTFTTRAAGEMRARLATLGVPNVQARTIHSAALRQAQYFWPKAYGVELPPVSSATLPIVARVAAGVIGPPNGPQLRDLTGEISWAKASNVSPAEYERLAEISGREVEGITHDQIATIMQGYERVKLAEGVIDFDDILLCAAALLHEHEDIARRVQQAYQYFVIDEYQDISAIQHRLIKLWVGDRPDLCVVGDPNQAIHSFAGARPEFLTSFRSDWPDAILLQLDRNYRSSPQILKLANQVIGTTGLRLRPMSQAGPTPELITHDTDAGEAAGVADWLVAKHDLGIPWSELAVLYRINAQAPGLEAALTEAGVPYLVRGTERYYERAEIKQLLSLIRTQAAEEPNSSGLTTVNNILHRLGWTEQAPVSQGAQREKWESLHAMRDLIAELAEENPNLTSSEVLVELTQRANWQQAPVGQAVTLATMHAAKGLEWSGVALIGIREGLMPFVLADTPAALAEERRLLYVGITRARSELRVSWVSQSGRGRSRFLNSCTEQVVSHKTRLPKRITTIQSRRCRCCNKSLNSAAERKLGRHLDCPSKYDENLFEELRNWRKQQAEIIKAPAFVVFTDATLIALAELAPTDLASLIKIPGIGKVKADRYGAEVLAIINSAKKESNSSAR